jgi:hypothetical protein
MAARTNASQGDELLPTTVRRGLLGEYLRRKNRGRSEVLATFNAPSVTLLECSGDNELAAVTTIACSLRARDDDAVFTGLPAVRGFAQWGTDGFMARAEFDFTEGTVLSLSGSYQQITAQIDLSAPDNGGDAMPAVVVGTHVSYLPQAAPPVFRTRYFALAEAGDVLLSIPPFARSVRVQKSIDATVLTVDLLTRAGTIVTQQISAAPIEMQIPNDARVLRVTTGAAIVGRAIFSLWI